MIAAALALGLAALPNALAAAEPAAPDVAAVKVATAPPFDPDFASGDWSRAPHLSHFTDLISRRPAENATDVSVAYDDAFLYVGFRCDQRRARITATQRTNNVGFGSDDYVQVGLDTSGTGGATYFFGATPLGTTYQTAAQSSRFDVQWTARTAVLPTGWSALLAVPLRSMKIAARKTSWRVNFVRYVAATGELDSWSFDPTMRDTTQSQFWRRLGALDIRGERPRPSFDLYALASGGADRARYVAPSGATTAAAIPYAGADATVPLTAGMNAVVTLHPDFSNAEVDQLVIAPQQFARQYVEYRPFFARGAGYFDHGVSTGIYNDATNQILFTPSIGAIDRGEKIEGTIGQNAVGALDVAGPGVRDQAFGLARTSRNQSTIVWSNGVFAHHDAVADETVEIGARHLNLHSGLTGTVQFVSESGSLIRDPSLARSVFVQAGVRRYQYRALVGYRDVGPEFGPLDGYTRIADVRGPFWYTSTITEGKKGARLAYLYAEVQGYRYRDRTGAVHASDFEPYVETKTRNATKIWAGTQTSSQRFYASASPAPGTIGTTLPFNTAYAGVTFGDGTPSPATATYGAGPFATFYLQQSSFSVTRSGNGGLSAGARYATTHERYRSGLVDGQTLREISLSRSLGAGSSASIALRNISGGGGFALPGENLAFTYHRAYPRHGDLYIDFGSPAAYRTLERTIVKYVWHVGETR